MIYARAYDQTVADDYFAAMARIEQRLDVVPAPEEVIQDQVATVQSSQEALELTEELALPELSVQARIGIAAQLRELLGLWEMGEAAPLPSADFRAQVLCEPLPCRRTCLRGKRIWSSRGQLDRLGLGAEVTQIPWGSKRFRLPRSSLAGSARPESAANPTAGPQRAGNRLRPPVSVSSRETAEHRPATGPDQ
jgi:hypothetical protein